MSFHRMRDEIKKQEDRSPAQERGKENPHGDREGKAQEVPCAADLESSWSEFEGTKVLYV